MGCGIGKFTPLLAQAFAQVNACDWAETALKQAEASCSEFDNTTFQRLDLSNDRVPFEPVDFAICINVLIMPSFDDRMRAWRTVTNQVNQGGTLLLVVPSHESTQMEYYRDIESRLDMGDSCREATEACAPANATVEDLQQGIFSCQGTRMKYYLRDELIMLLNGLELDVREIKRIQYAQDEASGSPATWDWLIMAQRRQVEEN
ncbi:class I SAM-dependent methyltransferase [Pelagicoccus mobilis]|uniref:Class I SAM-dependent methyltransferase n=1 Tax=Pelagicoccus mobilis TaxID=415221 RepID=A0A934VSK7_9BACT|nr:class I SAM-dependent methyltransferase [Pelagicoccus mobilis]MBK1878768.1 class I SAM-dependent methyltransferase [Pelagicoccus mobilis]